MRTGIWLDVFSIDRHRLWASSGTATRREKHAWRAEIVLLTAEGLGTVEIMRRTGKSKTCVWRWQERFAEEGFEGLLRDKTRPSRIPPLGAEVAERVVALTLADPPAETTHWTAAMMAQADGHLRQLGAAHLARARPAAAPGAAVQALQRSAVRRQAAGTWSGSTSIRRRTPSCCRSTRRAMCGWPPARKRKVVVVGGLLAVMCPAC